MNFIIDTSLLIFILNSPHKIKDEIKDILNNPVNNFSISIVSLWEITIKQSIFKLEMNLTVREIAGKLIANSLTILPIKISHLIELKKLPFHHKDPFDRLIISQAIFENLSILTSDTEFPNYDINVILN